MISIRGSKHRELPDRRATTLLTRIDGEPGGFAQPTPIPLPVAGDLDIAPELWRIYLDRGLDAKRIWLGVRGRNEAALGLYRRNGF